MPGKFLYAWHPSNESLLSHLCMLCSSAHTHNPDMHACRARGRGNGVRPGRAREGRNRSDTHTRTNKEGIGGELRREAKTRPGRPRLPNPSLTKRFSPRRHPRVEVNASVTAALLTTRRPGGLTLRDVETLLAGRKVMRGLTMVHPVPQQTTGLPTHETTAAALRSSASNTSLGPLWLRIDRTTLQWSRGPS